MAGKRGAPIGNQNAKGGRGAGVAIGFTTGILGAPIHSGIRAAKGKDNVAGYHAAGGAASGLLHGAATIAATRQVREQYPELVLPGDTELIRTVAGTTALGTALVYGGV
jgi:hypothetical protein